MYFVILQKMEYVVFIALVVIAVIIFFIFSTPKQDVERGFYDELVNANNVKIKGLFTQYERQFYYYLRKEVDIEINIFAKIRLIDFIGIRQNMGFKDNQIIMNKLNRKHIDYVLLDDNGFIICGIELDGKSHNYDKKTIENDEFKNYLFNEIGVKLFRFKVGETWSFEELKKYVAERKQK